MKVHKAEFVTSAKHPDQYPPPDRSEVAFAGRSNAGKSSLINTLVNRKKLVHTSKKPGKTQRVNFFNVNDQFYLVDLPGYGFADVPQQIKKDWDSMIQWYLSTRPTLRAMVCVMDIRHGVSSDDLMLLEALPHFEVQPILVFTKADKLSTQKRKRRMDELADNFGVESNELVAFSSLKDWGSHQLWKRLRPLLDTGR